MKDVIIHMTFAKVFLYKGVTLEWHDYLGPIILRRNTEVERNYKNVSLRTWGLVNKFAGLSKEEKQQYRLY